MLPPLWQKVALFNPIVYLASAGSAGASTAYPTLTSLSAFSMIAAFMLACFAVVWVIFRTGYKLKA